MEIKNIKEKDKNNLDILIKNLESKELNVDLRGSVKESSDYNDIDLNVWDTKKDYRENRNIISGCLTEINAKEIDFNFIPTTWVTGRWRFKINETYFDLIYTPSGPHFQGYVQI